MDPAAFHAAPLSTVLIACFRPSCASEMTSRTPARPRFTRLRRNAVQKPRSSDAPTSTPRIWRSPPRHNRPGTARAARAPIPLETSSGLGNVRGSVAMARDTPNSATAEFFINLEDNGAGLDPKPGAAPNTTGYAVFGHVIAGMDVVDKIAAVPIGNGSGPFPDAEPVTPVVIEKVTVSEPAP